VDVVETEGGNFIGQINLSQQIFLKCKGKLGRIRCISSWWFYIRILWNTEDKDTIFET
jgi:hypothetical protein